MFVHFMWRVQVSSYQLNILVLLKKKSLVEFTEQIHLALFFLIDVVANKLSLFPIFRQKYQSHVKVNPEADLSLI